LLLSTDDQCSTPAIIGVCVLIAKISILAGSVLF